MISPLDLVNIVIGLLLAWPSHCLHGKQDAQLKLIKCMVLDNIK